MFSGAGIRTIASVRTANDGLRFLLELGLLVAAAYWGWTEGHGWTSWLLVVTWSAVFGGLVALHLALTFLLDQR